MNLKLLINIAKTLLMARFRQTLIAAIGVMFSITMFITLISFMTGLNGLLDGLILNRTPHVRLYNEIKPAIKQPSNIAFPNELFFVSSIKSENVRKDIYNSASVIKFLKQDERVDGVATKLNAPVFFTIGDIKIAASVSGIEPMEENRLFKFGDYLTGGDLKSLIQESNSIMLGKGLADKLMAKIGDVVYLNTPNGDRYDFKVVGFVQIGIADIDNIQCYASIQTTQKILGKPSSYVTDIQVRLKDIKQAPSVAKEYAQLFNLDAIDVQTANAQFETGTGVRNIITYAVSITLLVVAGFGIYNILNMLIYEKMDTIAILKATGFSGSDVKWIFILISMIIGVAGGVFGLIFGYLLSSVIDNLPFETQALPTISTFPVNFNVAFHFIGITFALVTTYLAGLFPALKASKIDPVIIIRGK